MYPVMEVIMGVLVLLSVCSEWEQEATRKSIHHKSMLTLEKLQIKICKINNQLLWKSQVQIYQKLIIKKYQWSISNIEA